jgi:hypothetical protein
MKNLGQLKINLSNHFRLNKFKIQFILKNPPQKTPINCYCFLTAMSFPSITYKINISPILNKINQKILDNKK